MKKRFNRWLALLAVAAIVCVALPLGALAEIGTAVIPLNLLPNGGFEQGAEGWTVDGDTAVSNDAYGGEQAMLLGHPFAWGEALTRVVEVEANTDFTLTFWTKRVSGTVVWDVFIYNKDTMTVLNPTAGNNWIVSTGEWTQTTLEFNSSVVTKLFLKFCPESTSSGNILLDDVVLCEKTETPTPDIPDQPDPPVVSAGLQNGDFEQGADGWTIGGNTAVSGDAYGGNQSMKLSHTFAWGEALTQTVGVDTNTDYVLSFWTKRAAGSGAWNVFIYNKDTMTVIEPTEGVNWFAPGSDWTQVTIEFNSIIASNLFLKFCPESASAGEVLVDDVVLYKKGEEPTPDDPEPPVVTAGLQNGNFEKGAEGWGLGGNAALNSTAHSGNQAMLLSNTIVWGETLTQIVGVEKDTPYVLSFWTKRASGSAAWDVFIYNNDTMIVLPLSVGENWFSPTDAWTQVTVEFNSAAASNLFLKFCPDSTDSGDVLVDDVLLYKKGDEPVLPPDPPTPPAPSTDPLVLDSFGVDNNRPMSDEQNLVVNADFESAEGAQWNVDTFLGEGMTVVEDATAPEGNHSLYFNPSGTTESEAVRRIFWVEIEPHTTYVFSTWLKGAYLSADNAARATVGVIDPDTEQYLVYRGEHSSTAERQLLPPAWDNEWHLRSVSFNSEEKTRIGVAVHGYGSQLWLDGIALYKADDGVKYISANMLESVSFNYVLEHTTCKDEDSLTQNVHLEDGVDYWKSGNGWRNGFLSVQESAYEYGASLKYTASNNPCGVHYIKWIDVKPDTDYIFSADVKILEDGDGKLVLLDGKKRDAFKFLEVDFTIDYYGDEWFQAAQGFNTGLFETIGIAIVDAGGAALIDNIRLFEAVDGAAVEDAYVAPPQEPDPRPEEDPVIEPEQEEVTDPESDTDTEPEKKPVKKAKKKYRPAPAADTAPWLWIGIGSGVVVLAGLSVLYVLWIKRRKKAQQTTTDTATPDTVP